MAYARALRRVTTMTHTEVTNMVYATNQSFDGQRASVGRNVVVRRGNVLWAGIIDGIVEDEPEILTLNDGDTRRYRFASVHTDADIGRAPDCSWFWPPRV